jgi:type II secretory pathway pseudopilin PulG
MIVVSIIGILATIAIPKFASLVRKSTEASTKGSLGALRSAVVIYYSDMEGQFPFDLTTLTISGKYMTSIPLGRTPNYHVDSAGVANECADPSCLPALSPPGMGFFDWSAAWYFANDPSVPLGGLVIVDCFHTDTHGTSWSTY